MKDEAVAKNTRIVEVEPFNWVVRIGLMWLGRKKEGRYLIHHDWYWAKQFDSQAAAERYREDFLNSE